MIQRRKDGSVDFNRPWSDYEKGFVDLNGEFWYSLNCLTQTGQWELRVDFEFKNKTRSYLHYNVFKVGSATDEYPLTISGFTGTSLILTHLQLVDTMARSLVHMIMIMINLLLIVQHKVTVLKTMEDGGTIVAGTLISTSNTIQHSMGQCCFLVVGTIPGG